MDLWNWISQSLQVDSWGVTPMALVAPFGLLTVAVMARRFVRARGPKTESADVAGMALVAVIVGAAFLFIFEGLGLVDRAFR